MRLKDEDGGECECDHLRSSHSSMYGCIVHDNFREIDKPIRKHSQESQMSEWCYCNEYKEADMFKKCIEEVLKEDERS